MEASTFIGGKMFFDQLGLISLVSGMSYIFNNVRYFNRKPK